MDKGRTIKMYQFFLCLEHIDSRQFPGVIDTNVLYNEELEKEYVLYAYTIDKAKAKVFRTWRDPELFMERVIDISEPEYDAFTTMHGDEILTDSNLSTRGINEYGFIILEPVLVTTTCKEFQYLTEETVDYVQHKLKTILGIEFLPTVKDIVNEDLEFIFREIIPLTLSKDILHPFEDGMPGELAYDHLQIFLELFSNTFRIGGYHECYGNSYENLLKKSSQTSRD